MNSDLIVTDGILLPLFKDTSPLLLIDIYQDCIGTPLMPDCVHPYNPFAVDLVPVYLLACRLKLLKQTLI
jgi:hypothetical protein